jgi:pimeloyl-ACP methyl ester carboxylesterase
MGSGFSTQAWNLDEAVKTNAELVGIFKAKFTTTKKVVAWGYSMGGGITQAFAEKNPELLASAAVMNPVDAFNAQTKYFIDMLWLIKTWFDPSIKLTGYAPGLAGDMQMLQDGKKYAAVLTALKVPLHQALGQQLQVHQQRHFKQRNSITQCALDDRSFVRHQHAEHIL